MSVQDILMAIGSALFSIALVPSIRSKDKPAKGTSLLTGTVLAVFTGCYVSLGLVYASVTTGITALLWFVLLYQRLRYPR